MLDDLVNTTSPNLDGMVLVGLNARFSHTCLAIRCLKSYLLSQWPDAPRAEMIERTINDSPASILYQLYLKKAKVYAFSCYIWNIALVARLSSELKKILPGTCILWGGPEISHDAPKRLDANPAIDYIIRGEGEAAFLAFARAVFQSADFSSVPGLSWKDPDIGGIHENPVGPLLDAAAFPLVYSEPGSACLSNRILYYETSRGCPFQCGYCMSALDKTVRYRPLPLVYEELDRLMTSGLLHVKLVDRTFNDRTDRARAIWQHIIEKQRETGSRTKFHFEVKGDLLDDETTELLNSAPSGLIKLEMGVQTIHPAVLGRIGRTFRPLAMQRQTGRLHKAGRVHLHLDLIAGLPGETLQMFAESFNWVYRLSPHQLQLGFLKVLPGSPIRDQSEELGLSFQDFPPYEILKTDALSFDDLVVIKAVARLVDQYYNSGLFKRSLAWLTGRPADPFGFFKRFAAWLPMAWKLEKPFAPAERARQLWLFAQKEDRRFFQDNMPVGTLLDLIRADYLSAGHKDQPEWMKFWENTADHLEHQEIRRLREKFRRRFPHCRRFLLEKFNFDWDVLERDGQLACGEWIACFDLSGTRAVLLDIVRENTLY